MERNNKLNGMDTKKCMCYYFHDITKIVDLDFDNMLLDEKNFIQKYFGL